MTPEEFLLARIVEAEQALQNHVLELSLNEFTSLRNLALLMREALKLHQQWPILVSDMPELEFEQVDGNNFSYVATQRFVWLTNEEYVKKFGTAPPTSNMLRAWLVAYRMHPDFQQEWL